METHFPILYFLAGLFTGGVVVFILSRSRFRIDLDKKIKEKEMEISVLSERLKNKGEHLSAFQNDLEKKNQELAILHEELKEESNRRSAAEEKNERIPVLESVILAKEKTIYELQAETTELKTKLSEANIRLFEERKALEEKLALVENAERKLSDAFKALSIDVLKSSNQSFLELAKETLAKYQEAAITDLDSRQRAISDIVAPLKESLQQVYERTREIENARISAYASITEQLKSLSATQLILQTETANLVNALRTPTVRGRWGEIQLRRVVEIAGMLEYCDFIEQGSIATEEGRLRPDMTIRLPNNRNIVVDSKTPLNAYLEALEAPNEELRSAKLKDHARQVRVHLLKLGKKEYWDQFNTTPEFAVLFMPGESFFSAALQHDPGLIEFGVEQRVILATPTTLIALLKAVAYGWRQARLTESAQEISRLGKLLYERISVFTKHFAEVGKMLNQTVEHYNKAAGSLEGRVIVTARKFKEFGVSTKDDIAPLESIDRTTRELSKTDLIDEKDSDNE